MTERASALARVIGNHGRNAAMWDKALALLDVSRRPEGVTEEQARRALLAEHGIDDGATLAPVWRPVSPVYETDVATLCEALADVLRMLETGNGAGEPRGVSGRRWAGSCGATCRHQRCPGPACWVCEQMRPCTVCQMPADTVRELETAALQRGSVAGLSDKYGPSRDAIARHLRHHLPRRTALAAEAADAATGNALLIEVHAALRYAKRMRARWRTAGNASGEVGAQREVREMLTLLARIKNEIAPPTLTLNVLGSVEFRQWMTTVVAEFAPSPDAQLRLAAHLHATANAASGPAAP